MYEKFTVEVDKACGDGTYRSYSINSTGRLLKTIEDGHTTMRLYEWVDRGYVVYLVHVEEDKARRPPRRTLYPFINTHSSWKMNSQKFSSRIRRLAYPFL